MAGGHSFRITVRSSSHKQTEFFNRMFQQNKLREFLDLSNNFQVRMGLLQVHSHLRSDLIVVDAKPLK
jgi:hypothetical protein